MINKFTKISLYFATTSTIFALVISISIATNSIGNYDTLSFYAPLATFLVSYSLWQTFMSKCSSIKRGVFIGVLTVILSHYFTWYFMLIGVNIEYHILGLQVGSLNDEPIDLISGIGYMWGYTFLSLLFFGWITIPIGGIVGGMLGYFMKKATK